MTPPVQPAPAVDPSSGSPKDPNELIGVQFPQSPLPDILLWYEDETGKKIIRDINVEQVTITIDTTGQLPRSKAIEYVERSLLLNGYAFIPVDEYTVKFLNVGAIKPSGEMTPENIYTDITKLPQDERIVTFIQPLVWIDAEDLRKSLGELIPQAHPYQIISPLPNSKGIIITENSNTIRYIVALLTSLDVEPSKTDQRTFQLERADAEEVAEALAEILDLEGKGKSGGSGTSKTNYNPATPPAAPPQPGQPAQATARAASPAVYGAAPQATATPPKIIPIKRKNCLLVIATPFDLVKIEKLIEELDSAAVIRTFTTRKLIYLNATEVLPIIQDAITRGMDEGTGSSGAGTSQPGSLAGGTATGNNNNNRNSSFGSNSSFGNNSGGLGGSGGGGSGSGFGGSFGSSGGSGGLAALAEKSKPQSLVIGKTLLIAIPVANEIFASGPPEQLRILNELLDEIDKRPLSVVLNVVIGQLTLGDKRDVGIDYLFRPTQFGKQGTIAGTAGSRVGSNNTFLNAAAITPDKLLSGTGIGTGLALFGTLNDQVSVAVSALSTNTDFKLLSRPILYTLNNMPAVIESGVKIPIPTPGYGGNGIGTGIGNGTGVDGTGSNGFSSGGVSYQDVNLSLEVTPHINGTDELTLEVKQTNANQAGTTRINGNDISNISQQRLDTTVMIKNLSTVVLGGIITEGLDKQKGGIPILRHIPIIKYIAGSSKTTKDRTELLIFIQPRIVSGDGDLPPAYMDSAGSTALGADARRFMNQEKSDPDPDKQTIHRSRIGRLIHKLFE